MEKGRLKRRPDYHQTTQAIVSTNKEAVQAQESNRRQISRRSGPREARLAQMALSQWEMVFRGELHLKKGQES